MCWGLLASSIWLLTLQAHSVALEPDAATEELDDLRTLRLADIH